MNMKIVAEMINDRRGKGSYDDIARDIGIKTATLHRAMTLGRDMSVPSISKIALWAKAKNDRELLNTLASYALGFPVYVSLDVPD